MKLKIVGMLLILFFIAMIRSVFTVYHSSFYDLGIYSEALSRIHAGDWNPSIPGRNIFIFNDHFDPVLIPVSFFTRWISPPVLGMISEYLVLLLCWFPLNRLVKAGRISEQTATFGFAFIALNHATTDALQTPFHPTTWGMLPLMFLLSSVWLEETWMMILSLLALFCCREEFPLMGLSIGFMMMVMRSGKKQTLTGALTLVLSMAWAGFVFFIRPKVFAGDIVSYGSPLILKALRHPFEAIASNLSPSMIRFFLERTLPLFLLLRWRDLKANFRWFAFMLLATSPVFLIRIASRQWAFHYGTAPLIALLFALLPALESSISSRASLLTLTRSDRLRNGLAYGMLFVIFMSELVKLSSQSLIQTSPTSALHQRFPNLPGRTQALARSKDALEHDLRESRQASGDGQSPKLLVENNLAAPLLLHPEGRTVYFSGGPQPATVEPYDYIWVEKPPFGDPWPLDLSKVEKLIQTARSTPGAQLIQDDEFVFLVKGKFFKVSGF